MPSKPPPPSASRPNRRETLSLGLAAAGLVSTTVSAQEASPEPTFTLLLVNDIYLMSEVDGRGGFARLNAIVKAERARNRPLFYCHAGDCLSPSLMSGLDKGAHIIELLNLAPPDLFVPGNHEFDFGPEIFGQRIAEARFTCLGANLRDAKGESLPGIKDSVVQTLGQARVGIIGIALEATPQKSQSGDLQFAREIETLEKHARAMRADGIDFVIGLAHTARPTDEEIVKHRIVDILLSGHDHDLCIQDDGRSVLVESSHDAHVVTAVDVFLSREMREGKPTVRWYAAFRIHDSRDVTPDPETLAIVQRYEAKLSAELDVPIGKTIGPLDSRIASVRAAEASFGDLVADAVRSRTGAQIGLINGGGIRANTLYPAGTMLTRRIILTELPFGNSVVLVEISGRVLRSVLENGYADLGRPSGRFLQVSGLVVTLDPTASAGQRVVSVTIGGEPLDDTRTYKIAANNFMLDGGNGYGMLANGKVLVGATDGQLLASEVIAYITAHSPLPAETGGRIVIKK